jgi:DNA-binding transcriptional regulator PaaX
LNSFVDDWRLGESRMRAWQDGQWLICHLPGPADRSEWALESLGFRQLKPGLWARPDNLSLEFSMLKARLHGLGLDRTALLLGPCQIDAATQQTWRNAWRVDDLAQKYRSALQRVQNSARRLATLPRQQAKLESFTVGGEIIHLLAKDPLLPSQWLDGIDRDRLGQAMALYDQQGKDIWAASEGQSPTHLPRPQHPFQQTQSA